VGEAYWPKMDYPFNWLNTLKAVGLEELEKGISVMIINQERFWNLKIQDKGKAGQTIKTGPRGILLKCARRLNVLPQINTYV